MCLTCSSSSDAMDTHGDFRNLTWGMLSAAAEAAGVTPAQALANAVATLAYGGEPVDDPDGGQETAAELEAALDEADEALAVTKGVAGCAVVKMAEERRFTLGVAIAALHPDVAKGVDGFQDFVGPELTERTAWAWMAKSRQIGLFHSDVLKGQISTGHGTVVESYVYRGPDWSIEAADGSTRVVKAGDWLLGVQWDEPAWAAIKARAINGFSIQGRGRRGRPTPDRLAALRA